MNYKKSQNDKVGSTHAREVEELERHRLEGVQQLQSYQANQRREMLKQQQKEREDLNNRINSRHETLEAVVKKNAESTREEACKKKRRLTEQHAQVLRDFDTQTASLGIDNAAVLGAPSRFPSSDSGGAGASRGSSLKSGWRP